MIGQRESHCPGARPCIGARFSPLWVAEVGIMEREDKVVWITGASSGIGAALAVAYARRGARLVLSSRRREALEEVVRHNGLSPDRIALVPLDLGEPETLAAKAVTGLAAFGRVDVLINNGGVSQRSLARETRLEVDRRLMTVNYLGTVGLTKAVLPAMIERGYGRIVTVTSVVGKFGTPYRSSYAASKHALHGFFDSLRAELRGTGVGVTVLCPGFVRTDVSLNALTGDGTPQGTMDDAQAAGMSPERCAERMITAIEAGRREVLIGGREILAVHLNRLLPGLFARVIARAKVT